jgi:hypothetical protein
MPTKRTISAAEALRLCVKARQPDRAETTLMSAYLGGRRPQPSDSQLKCQVGGQVATIPHCGYFLLEKKIIVPLHDESYIVVEGVSEDPDGVKTCSGFSLIVGNDSLSEV